MGPSDELYEAFKRRGYEGVRVVINVKDSVHHKNVLSFLERLGNFEERSRKVVLEAKVA